MQVHFSKCCFEEERKEKIVANGCEQVIHCCREIIRQFPCAGRCQERGQCYTDTRSRKFNPLTTLSLLSLVQDLFEELHCLFRSSWWVISERCVQCFAWWIWWKGRSY